MPSPRPSPPDDRPPDRAGAPDQLDSPAHEQGAARFEDLIDDLYVLDPSGFVAGRSALVAAARQHRDRDLAKAIGKLPRPSRAAFALNLLARRRPEDLGRLLRLAESLREASGRLAGSELRKLGSTRQQLIAELASAAGRLVTDAGTTLGPGAREEIEETLQAALLDEEAAAAVASGRLVRSLRVAGFGTVELSGALAPLHVDRPAPVRPEEEEPTKEQGGKKDTSARRAGKGGAAGDEAAGKGPNGAASGRPHGGASDKARLEKADEARARRKEADETARRARSAARAARKEAANARRARERAVGRREAAEAALLRARRDELESVKAQSAAESAEQNASAALEAAERRARRDVPKTSP
jgi:hypothetical protein